jgi:hypothetical protein
VSEFHCLLGTAVSGLLLDVAVSRVRPPPTACQRQTGAADRCMSFSSAAPSCKVLRRVNTEKGCRVVEERVNARSERLVAAIQCMISSAVV